MTEELDNEMQVNFACAGMILCSILEMFLVIMRYTIVDSSTFGSEGLIATLLTSVISVLCMALSYRVLKGSKRAWWTLMIVCILGVPTSIYATYMDIVFSLELIGLAVFIVLLLIPAVKEHCNVHFRKHDKIAE